MGQESASARTIEKDLFFCHKLIKFSHKDDGFDFKKVNTRITLYYDGEKIPETEFFLEQKDFKSDSLDVIIPIRNKSVKVVIETITKDYDLDKINVDIIS